MRNKIVNYNLYNGKVDMKDMELVLNPDGIKADYIPQKIQHYPIIKTKVDVLRGEESARIMEYSAVVTNPNAISQMEQDKAMQIRQSLEQWLQESPDNQSKAEQALDNIFRYYDYEYQDMKEVRDNALMRHYEQELNFNQIFNDGFVDACIVAEEVYQVDIVGGEPTLERVDNVNLYPFGSGYSDKIEDADVLIMEQYLPMGKIVDQYYEVLSKKDLKTLEKMQSGYGSSSTDSYGNYDFRPAFARPEDIDADGLFEEDGDELYYFGLKGGSGDNAAVDGYGNIRVLKVYWKSLRRMKKVKQYDPETGEEIYNLYSDKYVIDKDAGDEEEILYVNEAWEGTLIGNEIFVNMRPRTVQYNRMSNPSRCHFGIIGQIYNINHQRAVSLVDVMRPYSYLYDVIHDRLNKAIANDWGSLFELDLAQIPYSKGWDMNKWMHFAKVNKIAVKDSREESMYGASTGKLAGQFAGNSKGVINASDYNYIQQLMNLLQYIKLEMSETAGISPQREGQVKNYETVGGVERSTLQSSYITESLFMKHEDLKRRVLQAFIDTAKIAAKGKKLKFNAILSDNSRKLVEIDGDEFSEYDSGIVVTANNKYKRLEQNLDMLAQAGLQNKLLTFSALTKLYSNASIAEKIRIIQRSEEQMKLEQQQQAEQQQQMLQQQLQVQQQMEQQRVEHDDMINARNNETKIEIARINGIAEAQRFAMMNDPKVDPMEKEKLMEKMRQFDKQNQLDIEKFRHQQEMDREEAKNKEKELDIKARQVQASKASNTTKTRK